MARFFVNRPIVAIVIAIVMVIVGVVALLGLPVSQYPNIVPPEIFINTTYVGADAQTVEQSVATPIEQEMSGVDNMNYMYSLNANNGELKMYVNFDVKTDPNIDQVLTQMRESQAEAKLPADVRNYGVTVKKSTAAPLMVVNLISPNGTYDAIFLANYAYINLNDQITRVAGHRQRHRVWGRPICHALLGQARPTGQAQHHHSRDRRRHPETEHRQPLGPGGGGAGPGRPGIHLRHPLPGPAGKSGGV
jgi:multidrug efflux pump subunit AcrB